MIRKLYPEVHLTPYVVDGVQYDGARNKSDFKHMVLLPHELVHEVHASGLNTFKDYFLPGGESQCSEFWEMLLPYNFNPGQS